MAEQEQEQEEQEQEQEEEEDDQTFLPKKKTRGFLWNSPHSPPKIV